MIFSVSVAEDFCSILRANEAPRQRDKTLNLKQNLIVLLACLATQIALGEPSLAEKNAAENAAIKKEWESWNASLWTAVASEARHRFRTHRTRPTRASPLGRTKSAVASDLPAQST